MFSFFFLITMRGILVSASTMRSAMLPSNKALALVLPFGDLNKDETLSTTIQLISSLPYFWFFTQELIGE